MKFVAHIAIKYEKTWQISLTQCYVGSSQPRAVAGSKGWAVRPWKRYVSWVQNVVNCLRPGKVICLRKSTHNGGAHRKMGNTVGSQMLENINKSIFTKQEEIISIIFIFRQIHIFLFMKLFFRQWNMCPQCNINYPLSFVGLSVQR